MSHWALPDIILLKSHHSMICHWEMEKTMCSKIISITKEHKKMYLLEKLQRLHFSTPNSEWHWPLTISPWHLLSKHRFIFVWDAVLLHPKTLKTWKENKRWSSGMSFTYYYYHKFFMNTSKIIKDCVLTVNDVMLLDYNQFIGDYRNRFQTHWRAFTHWISNPGWQNIPSFTQRRLTISQT